MRALYVALGAALGAPTRFLIDQYFRKLSEKPFGIFIVNVFGSFILGLAYSRQDHWHDLVGIGFAGSFTTWSTFILDLYLGYENRRYRESLINLIASLIIGLAAAYLGLRLVR